MTEDKMQALCAEMADKLPLFRKAMGTTQARFAQIAGVTRNTIINIERNKTMGWPTYLSFLLIFSKQENTRTLIRAFDLYPEELDAFLTGRNGTDG